MCNSANESANGYIIFRLQTDASRMRSEKSRHRERGDVRITIRKSTAEAISYRDRLNGTGYVGRAYAATVTESGEVVTANGMRVRR